MSSWFMVQKSFEMIIAHIMNHGHPPTDQLTLRLYISAQRYLGFPHATAGANTESEHFNC